MRKIVESISGSNNGNWKNSPVPIFNVYFNAFSIVFTAMMEYRRNNE